MGVTYNAECVGKRSTDLDEQYGAESFDLLIDAWGTFLAHAHFPKGVLDCTGRVMS